jgi:hypothetical protein
MRILCIYINSCRCGIETLGVRNDHRSVEEYSLSIESWSAVQGVGTEYTPVEFKRFRNALLATWYVSEVLTFFRCRQKSFCVEPTHCIKPENNIHFISSNIRHST